MRKKATAALAVLSIAILAVGIWNYLALFYFPAKSSWEGRVGTGDPVFSFLGALVAAIGFVIVMRYYLGAVLLLWAVYGAVLLIPRLVRKDGRRRGQGGLPPLRLIDFFRKTK